MFFNLFLVACFLLSVFLSLFGHFVNFLSCKSVSPVLFGFGKFFHSFSFLLKFLAKCSPFYYVIILLFYFY